MTLDIDFNQNNPKMLILLWKGTFWREVSKCLFFNDLKNFPRQLDWEEFLSRFNLLEEKAAKRQAIALLSKRSYLSSDLESKLLSKGLSPKASKGAILFCQEKGYLNDSEEIARLIAKEQKKGLGAKEIYFRLRHKKRINEHQLRDGLNHTKFSEKEVLEKWLEKNARKMNRNDPLEMKKWMSKLIRRGFSAELVFQLIRS